jgi:hypothetical protein
MCGAYMLVSYSLVGIIQIMRGERVVCRPCGFDLFDLVFSPKVLDRFFPLRMRVFP